MESKDIREAIFEAFETLKARNELKEFIKAELMQAVNSFPQHLGRLGQVGGSLPRNMIDWSNKSNILKNSGDVNKYIYKLFQENAGSYKTLDPNWEIDLQLDKAKKVRHITYAKEWNNMSDAEKHRHNKYVREVEDLINHAKYLYPSPNRNPNDKDKKNVSQYHYFEVLIKTKTNIYKIILDTEEYKTDNKSKPQIVHLYNLHEQ